MHKFNEGLLAGDLKMLVDNIFEVDSYSSKMGEDKDIVVLAFTVGSQKPADDLVEFVEFLDYDLRMMFLFFFLHHHHFVFPDH